MKEPEIIDYKNPSKKDQIRFYSITFIAALVITVGYFGGLPSYWLGWMAFAVAAFSVAGNDAIQTIGTFIESKSGIHWAPKLFVFGLSLIIVHAVGWYMDGGEIHFHRLNSFQEPKAFNLLQLLAPIILVIITRMKAPVSTTFMVLGLFGSQNINKMLTKSFVGYGIAFISAFIVWGILAKLDPHEYTEDHVPDPKSEKRWATLQWFSTIYLWGAWLLQDTANIAVFLPRKLSIPEFCGAVGLLVIALGIIIKTNGGTIQEVVSEKSEIKWSKAATVVDIVYATILLVFQKWSKMPMSTTWVFLGLLAGREIILHIVTFKDNPYLDTFKKVGKDVMLASLGIAVSIGIFLLSDIIYNEGKSTGIHSFFTNQRVISVNVHKTN
ncbi:MAG: hypothetical protein IT569_01645 [Leptospiraceae bacterium]|nr:hypothetical protein [Leptospiraceae bacterium]